MKQSWLCASAAVVALGVGLAAQAPGQGQPATQAPDDTSAAGDAAAGDADTFNHVNGVRRTANDDVDSDVCSRLERRLVGNTRGGGHSRKRRQSVHLDECATRHGVGQRSRREARPTRPRRVTPRQLAAQRRPVYPRPLARVPVTGRRPRV